MPAPCSRDGEDVAEAEAAEVFGGGSEGGVSILLTARRRLAAGRGGGESDVGEASSVRHL